MHLQHSTIIIEPIFKSIQAKLIKKNKTKTKTNPFDAPIKHHDRLLRIQLICETHCPESSGTPVWTEADIRTQDGPRSTKEVF